MEPFQTDARESHLLTITNRPAPVMVRGAGSYLWDASGAEYLDMIQGWAVNCLGHCHPALVSALNAQAQRLWNPSPAYHNEPQLRLAQALTSRAGLERVFFCNSGAEANESAIKLARKWGATAGVKAGRNRFEVVATLGGFHGRTLATMAASGKRGFRGLFEPAVTGFQHVAFGDLQAMERAITRDTVAVMVEPIQGEAGVIVPPHDYLVNLRALCDQHQLLLIVDEVQTGMGRTGPLFAHQLAGIRPDIMTLGKGLGGGAPIAAMLCSEALNCFEPGEQGGTFNGAPLLTAVALEVVGEVGQAQFLQQAAKVGQQLHDGLLELCVEFDLVGVRGAGMLWALELAQPVAKAVSAAATDVGLLINPCRPTTLRLMPALNLTYADAELAVARLGSALSQSHQSNRVDR